MTTIFYELLQHLDELDDKVARNIEESEILQREIKDTKDKLLEAEDKLRKKNKE